MWILMLVFLVPINGFDVKYALESYATHEACLDARNRVGWEMAEAYPLDSTEFHIVCECPTCI